VLGREGNVVSVPADVAVGRGGGQAAVGRADLPVDAPALDLGPRTIEAYAGVLEDAGTAICNGPVGVFEREPFAAGTEALYTAATRAGYSIVGGGDTAAALRRLGVSGFDHVSTGGGAALSMLTGEALPAVEALRDAG
jgi:phosphoglycerate kinase